MYTAHIRYKCFRRFEPGLDTCGECFLCGQWFNTLTYIDYECRKCLMHLVLLYIKKLMVCLFEFSQCAFEKYQEKLGPDNSRLPTHLPISYSQFFLMHWDWSRISAQHVWHARIFCGTLCIFEGLHRIST
jgi:hypothetical protein